jgi:hypothetical protein
MRVDAVTEEREQFGKCLCLGGMVMAPERAKLTVEPDAMQVFEAALEMRVTFDVIEDVARLRLRQQ